MERVGVSWPGRAWVSLTHRPNAVEIDPLDIKGFPDAPAPEYPATTMPDLTHERLIGGRVAGVDEVGRGPLCGPVVAAAVILDPANLPDGLMGLDDSKRLSAAKREEFARLLKGCALVGVGAASVAEIESHNILQASLLAMRRALAALSVSPDAALIDGNIAPKNLSFPAHALVKGDQLSLSIAAASVVAKVVRDRAMVLLDQRYPGYGWSKNAGYGTAAHLAALGVLGVTPHHRRGFAPVREILALAATKL